MELNDKVAIVTGSGQGIGRAIALAMAREGASLVINDVQADTAGRTAAEIIKAGGQAKPFVGDISRFDIARQLVQAALYSFGRLDILINNAGVAGFRDFWEMTEEDWDRSVGVSLKGYFNCTRHACIPMKEQGSGRIINTTSMARMGTPRHANYCAAKAGVVGLTKAVAIDLSEFGITCNAYAPTALTSMTGSEESRAQFRKRYERGLISKQRYEEMANPPPPEAIPPLIIFLCSDAAADINGQVFQIVANRVAVYSETAAKVAFKHGGFWTVDELKDVVPRTLLEGYQNPAPPRLDYF